MRQITAKASGNPPKRSWHLFCRPCVAILFTLLLGAGLAAIQGVAQTVDATLRGTVRDNSGASVVGAKVVLSEPATGRVVREGASSASGDFEFDELQPGTYVLHCGARAAFSSMPITAFSGASPIIWILRIRTMC